MRSLIIAEKPELGRAIAAAIDGNGKEVRGVIRKQNVIITWAYGHLLRLCEPDEYDAKYKKWKKEDLPICFENWKLVPDGNKKDRVEQIMALMQECDQIIHAGDPDDEGQFLIDEILDYAQNEKPVKRVYINDNTPANIKKAFHDLIDNDEKLRAVGRSAYARAVADYVVGINYSRLFSLLLRRKGMSVGRVQSPTLGLIVMRDEAIDNHVKQKYYELHTDGHMEEPDTAIRFQLKPKSDLLDDGKHILHRNSMEDIEKNIMSKPDQKVKVDEKFMDVKPPLPFNLAKLQAHMNARYGFDLSKTDQITQTLRDRYQAITYNRSDSQYLKEEHFQEADRVLPHVMSKLNEQYPVDYKLHSECFNDKYVTAHHAIIPTMSDFNIAQLLPDERRVYEEICRYYIMQFLPPIRKRQLSAVIKTEAGDLRATSTYVLDEGYKKYFTPEKEDSQEEEEDDSRFDLPKGTYPIQLVSSDIQEKETNPPKRYTQASLIRDMTSIAKYVQDKEIKDILKKKDKDKKGENGSIGTSATRSQIVETLIKRRYVEMKGKNIISTQLGKDFYHLLPEEIKKPDLTAKWWVIQEDIKEGNADVKTLVDSVLEAFVPHLKKDYSNLRVSGEVEIDDDRQAVGICPLCGNKIVENSKGFGCVNYRNGCKFALWKEDRFFQSIGKEVTLPMAEKLLKDKYCLVKLKENEQEIIKVLQLGVRNGRAVYRLVDVPKKAKDSE
ncbi:DNA topoisomerase [[Clostridium] innocuum]|jgi:DNA topoisomerase III|nr:DNA topoisomerase III [Erysipelotrichaceae bacterium]MCR0382653.1 DNA topoisomerase [[Clostridium] innocuum]MCR0412480.1 DNA topoisomerase [[Clostridium] innocuum]MCR0533557.1 DNA topoisomerase [[Clostridium] innocuum]MCR0537168.1 DNA topoisomerase [[Clostridium] innocuum]